MEGSESFRAAIVNTIKPSGGLIPTGKQAISFHGDSIGTVFPFQVFILAELVSFAARFLMSFEMLSRSQTVPRPRAPKLTRALRLTSKRS